MSIDVSVVVRPDADIDRLRQVVSDACPDMDVDVDVDDGWVSLLARVRWADRWDCAQLVAALMDARMDPIVYPDCYSPDVQWAGTHWIGFDSPDLARNAEDLAGYHRWALRRAAGP